MAWLGEQPLVFLRNQIDEVDDQLAGLLARRQALTAAVQVRKPVGGHAGRDPQREREIAERMAARAPALGLERVARIVRSEEHTSELQSLMRISYAVFCLKK